MGSIFSVLCYKLCLQDMCILREYRQGDEDMVFALLESALKHYGLSVNPEETDADIQDIDESYIRSGGAFKVLEDNGAVVGSYGLYTIDEGTCELRKMYLQAEYKGRGLGKKMMEDAFIVAKSLGFSTMILETNSCLKDAVNLYKKYGFTEYTSEHLSHRCNCAMRKSL